MIEEEHCSLAPSVTLLILALFDNLALFGWERSRPDSWRFSIWRGRQRTRCNCGDSQCIEIKAYNRLKKPGFFFFVHLINGNLGPLKCSLYPLSMCSLVAMVTVSAHVVKRVILLGGIHVPISLIMLLLKMALILICEMRCAP